MRFLHLTVKDQLGSTAAAFRVFGVASLACSVLYWLYHFLQGRHLQLERADAAADPVMLEPIHPAAANNQTKVET